MPVPFVLTCRLLMFLKPPPPKLDMLSSIARVPGGSSGSVRCTCRTAAAPGQASVTTTADDRTTTCRTWTP
jgi:hypothetical protein